MSLQKAESMRTKIAGSMFTNAAKQVPTDKARWSPDDESASAYEIVQHLAGANYFFNAMIKNEPPPTPELDESLSYEEALEKFEESVETLARTTVNVSDEDLKATREMPWGQTWKVQNILMSGSLHISYHWGQIGYLQTIWGDSTDYHLQM
jgi:uncharacterized damage-inducible protein DinB